MQVAAVPITPPANRHTTDRLVSTVEAASIIGAKPATLEIWRWQGRGPRFVRVGRSVRYRLSDLNAYIESLSRFQSTTEADQAKGKEAA